MHIPTIHQLFDLKGKVVVITGGGGVLCSTMAFALGNAGAKIITLDMNFDSGKNVADQIKKHGGEALAIQCDVLNKDNLQAAAQQAQDTFGAPDILINGAGGNKPQATTSAERSFFDLPEEALQWVLNLNFMGTLLPSQVFGRNMAERGEGTILNISSMNAFRPLTRVPAYSTAKAAVSNFTAWLAVHMAQEYSPNIRVNALAPGFFYTKQNRFLLKDQESGELTKRGQQIIDHTPMGCFGEPEDLLGAVFWLLSPSASFVTGIVVPIDGGFSAYSGV